MRTLGELAQANGMRKPLQGSVSNVDLTHYASYGRLGARSGPLKQRMQVGGADGWHAVNLSSASGAPLALKMKSSRDNDEQLTGGGFGSVAAASGSLPPLRPALTIGGSTYEGFQATIAV